MNDEIRKIVSKNGAVKILANILTELGMKLLVIKLFLMKKKKANKQNKMIKLKQCL